MNTLDHDIKAILSELEIVPRNSISHGLLMRELRQMFESAQGLDIASWFKCTCILSAYKDSP